MLPAGWTRCVAVVSLLLPLCWLIAATSGCGSQPGAETEVPGNAVQAVAAAGLAPSGPLPLPSPARVFSRLHGVKSTSALTQRDGADCAPGLSQRMLPNGTSAIFSPAYTGPGSAFDTVAWAVYSFNLAGRAGLPVVHTVWTMPPGDFSKLWLGAANWETGRWDWYHGAPYGLAQTDALGHDAYRHPQTGEMYVAVVTLGEVSSMLSSVYLSGFAARGDWWMLGRDPAHTNWCNATGPSGPDLRWKLRLGLGDNTAPPVYDATGEIFISAYDNSAGKLFMNSLSPEGELNWSQRIVLPGGYQGGSCLALADNGAIYGVYPGGSLNCFAPSGAHGWGFWPGGGMNANPVVSPDGICYVRGGWNPSHSLYAVNSAGNIVWSYSFGDAGGSIPALGADGTLYICCDDGTLRALNPDGTERWRFTAGGALQFNPVVGNNALIYATSTEPKLYAVDAAGAQLWASALPGAPAAPMALAPDGSAFVPCADGYLHKFSPDGTPAWSFYAAAHMCSPALDAAGHVYVASANSRLYALSAAGEVEWYYKAADRLLAPPVIAEDGTIYLMDNDGMFYAVGPGGNAPEYTASGYVWDNMGAGLAGVTVTLTGEGPVLTDAAGFWSKGGLRGGNYLVCAEKAGYSFSPLFADIEVAGADVAVPDFTGAVAAAPGWAMWGGDRAHRRRSAAIGPAGPDVAWSVKLGEQFRSEPVVGPDGAVYALDSGGGLHALNADGTIRWQAALDYPTAASPALGANGAVYASCGAPRDCLIFAFSPAGTPLWYHEYAAGPQGSPTLTADGAVLHKIGFGALCALEPDGTQRWLFDSGADTGSDAVPAVADDGTLYLANGLDKLYALAPDGSLTWTFAVTLADGEARPPLPAPVVAEDGTVYLCLGISLYALNPDGTQQWQYSPGATTFATPALGADGTLYFGAISTEDGFSFRALNPDGTLQWDVPTLELVLAAAAVDANGTVFFGAGNDGAVYAFNPDGTQQWKCDAPAGVYAGPAIGVDGTLYVGDDGGTLYAIGPGGS